MISKTAAKKIDRWYNLPCGSGSIRTRCFSLILHNRVMIVGRKPMEVIVIELIATRENYRRRGICKAVLHYLENKGQTIVVENVISPHLKKLLKKRGYKTTRRASQINMYKRLSMIS